MTQTTETFLNGSNSAEIDPKSLFFLSDRISEYTAQNIQEKLSTEISIEEKVAYILKKKQEVISFFPDPNFDISLQMTFM